MSKSSTTSAPKNPPQLLSRSAWAKGPPQSNPSAPSPRSQSPAPINAAPPPNATHSRRASNLGQGVPIKDGVSIPRSNVGSVKNGSSPVTFGSIDDASAPLSSSPATAPSVKSEVVKSFGTVPAAPGHVNGKLSISSSSKAPSASSTPTLPSKPKKMDIHKMFQTPGSSSTPPSSSETSSPSVRPAALPSQQPSSSSSQPPPPQSQPYSTFVPAGSMRPPQQNSGAGGSSQGPRSPVYPRQLPNGNGAPRPANGPSGPPPAGLSSPRLGTQPHPTQPVGMPPMAVPGWPTYYYPPVPSEYMQQPYSPGWYIPQQLPHHPHHPPPPGPPGPPHGGMPMSPRNPPPPLQGPGTPTQQHAQIHSPHPTHSHSSSSSIGGITSPPPTPSSANAGLARLNTNANAFVPRPSKLTIKNADGQELTIEALKKQSPQPPGSPKVAPSSFNSSNRRSVIRMESEEDKKKRLAEEQAKERAVDKAKKDAERAKKEAEQKAKQEEERKKAEEEKERIRKEEEEKERIRKEEEKKEKARLQKEEQEKEQKRLEEARKKAEEEERERIRKEKEDEARRQAEAEKERVRLEEEKAKVAEAEAASKASEDGEVEEAPVEASANKPVEVPVETRPKESLRIDTELRKRPGPLDLSHAKDKGIPSALPSALATARIIEDLDQIQYPEGVMSPKSELNVNAKGGKFRYDREFLLQFMSVCREKPDRLPPLDAIGLEPADQSFPMSRGGSGRHRQPSGTGPPPLSRQNSVGLGIMQNGSFSKAGPNSSFSMGNFATPGSKMSSDERFAMANNGRVASLSGAAGLPFSRAPPPMVRSTSQGGPGGAPMGNNRTRSKRGEKRNENNKVGAGQQSHGTGFASSGTMVTVGQGGEPLTVVPLKASENRWVPGTISKKAVVESESPEIVDRKVKGLLNKLTMEKFESISDQIITWANKSEKEKDGRTLIQVIRLVFEKATDEATWSEMYARLCRKMMEQISSKVQDDGIKNSDGKPIAGGQLFRKYLLNRCQEDFERGWVAKEATAAAAATKASEDKAAMDAGANKDGESVLYSGEYYAAQKAKRQGLGLIKFIGELFKLQMLTERIMHECVKKLLGNVENPEEEEIESLCKLLTTVGSILDSNQKARMHMDIYFSRMKELTKSQNVSSRMQFMLQDVIELRERKWITRNSVAAPTTIAQIHEAAAKEKAIAEKEAYQRQMSMSRGGSRRGNDRNAVDPQQQVGPDGWAVAGGVPRPPKAGDLSQFGKINKPTTMTFGPSSVFAGKKGDKRESLSRVSSNSNMFSMLGQENAGEASSSKTGASEPAQRKRLQLLPRTKPAADEAALPVSSEAPSEDEGANEAMTEAEAMKKIEEDSKEFFGVRNLDEAEIYFTGLPTEHKFRLVDKLVVSAIESKESDAQLVADFFSRAAGKDLCSAASFEDGFIPTAEILDDIAIDAPKAFNLMAIMLRGSGLDKDEERRARIVDKSMDGDKLLSLLS